MVHILNHPDYRKKDYTIFDAIELATSAHKGQYRKGSGLPYIIHPLWVMQKLIANNCSKEAIFAGILHDVVEDTYYSFEDVKMTFGERVAQIVYFASEPDKSLSWQERKEHTIKSLQDCNDEDILYVTCADKLHNITCLNEDYLMYGEDLWQRFNAPKEKQKWYYMSLAKVFAEKDIAVEGSMFYEFKNEVEKLFNL